MLPPCYAEKLKWSRFINCHGFPGHNISCDLHIEHINRKIKTAIEGLGANKSEKAIVRTGNCGPLDDILSSYDKTAKIDNPSGKHSRHSISKELDKLIQKLLTYGAFDKSSGKQHRTFPNLKANLIKKLNENKVKEWGCANTNLLV